MKNSPTGQYDDLAAYALKRLLSEQGGWIDVNERLPESAGRCFVLRNNPIPYIVRFGTNEKWVMDNGTITHWLPLSVLPAQPTQGDNNG